MKNKLTFRNIETDQNLTQLQITESKTIKIPDNKLKQKEENCGYFTATKEKKRFLLKNFLPKKENGPDKTEMEIMTKMRSRSNPRMYGQQFSITIAWKIV